MIQNAVTKLLYRSSQQKIGLLRGRYNSFMQFFFCYMTCYITAFCNIACYIVYVKMDCIFFSYNMLYNKAYQNKQMIHGLACVLYKLYKDYDTYITLYIYILYIISSDILPVSSIFHDDLLYTMLDDKLLLCSL